MKPFPIIIICVLMLMSCKNKSEDRANTPEKVENTTYASFGEKIIIDDAIAANSMAYHYKNMALGDSIPSKMIGKVKNVCQAKGCWMTLDLEDGNEVMVKFKDYGFFVPKDISGKQVIINGKAFVNEVPVDEQRHYAEDAGESTENIERITEAKRSYSFEADGVLVAQ